MGDDLLIDAILSPKPSGWYVDIGCHDPVYLSNTFQLYLRGWKGLVVDANPQLIARFKRQRPYDIAVCAAVSNSVETRRFVISHHPEVSSLSAADIAADDVASESEVTTVTLTELLKSHDVPSRFDVLSIDIEGFDLPALSGLDWSFYRPQLVIVEMHGFDLTKASTFPLYELLITHGYRLVAFNMLNGFFMSQE